MRQFFLITWVLTVLLTQSYAHDGKETGNGGDGMKVGNQIFLIDLIEAGVELNPYFNAEVMIKPEIFERVKKALPVSSEVQAAVAWKISELDLISPITAISILRAMEAYSFRFVANELVNVEDEDSTIQYDPKILVQLAIRRDRLILIDVSLWTSLNVEHQTALIFHEMIYAMTPIVLEGNNSHMQPSQFARQVVGYLFHRDLKDKGIIGLRQISREASVVPVSAREVEEQKDGSVCLGKNIIFTTDGANGYFPLRPSTMEVAKKSKEICESLAATVHGAPTSYKPSVFSLSHHCPVEIEYKFEDYYQKASQNNYTIKSKFHLEKMSNAYAESKNTKTYSGVKVKVVNKRGVWDVGVINGEVCVERIENAINEYVKINE